VEYLLLIYANEAGIEAMDKAEMSTIMEDFGAFTDAIVKAGNYKGSNRLRPVSAATTVRVRGGKTLTTDGPFAETREQLGGYYLVEAADLDQAIAIAARIPGARYGSVEVRPVWPLGRA
jgi:hypothetical protein